MFIKYFIKGEKTMENVKLKPEAEDLIEKFVSKRYFALTSKGNYAKSVRMFLAKRKTAGSE
jgi:hypothetical protein